MRWVWLGSKNDESFRKKWHDQRQEETVIHSKSENMQVKFKNCLKYVRSFCREEGNRPYVMARINRRIFLPRKQLNNQDRISLSYWKQSQKQWGQNMLCLNLNWDQWILQVPLYFNSLQREARVCKFICVCLNNTSLQKGEMNFIFGKIFLSRRICCFGQGIKPFFFFIRGWNSSYINTCQG